MIWLGKHLAGASVEYGAVFHDVDNTPVDPFNPAARHRLPNGTFADLAAPAQLDSKTGYYGGAIDTTGFAEGIHTVRMVGTIDGNDNAIIFVFAIGGATAGTTWFYSSQFHDEGGQNATADPSNPAARLQDPAGAFVDLTAPVKIDSKLGWYGNEIDTTGFNPGRYKVYITGTINGHSVAGISEFEIYESAAGLSPDMSTWALSSTDATEIEGELVTVAADADTVVPLYRIKNDTIPNSWSEGTPIASPVAGSQFTLSGLTTGIRYEVTVASVSAWGFYSLVGNVLEVTPNPADTAPTDLDNRLRPRAGILVDKYGKYADYHVPQYVTDQAAGTRTKTDSSYAVKITPPEGFDEAYEPLDHLKPGDLKTWLADLDVDGNKIDFIPDAGHAMSFDGERWEIVGVWPERTGQLEGLWRLYIRSKK